MTDQESEFRFIHTDDGDNYIEKVTVVDLADVQLTSHPDGSIEVTEKPKAATVGAKYRLEPAENGLFQLVALRSIGRYIAKGTRGGLVASQHNLDQHGDSWIDAESKVTGDARVMDSAIVVRSVISGTVTVGGDAKVIGSTLTATRGGYIGVKSAKITESRVEANDRSLEILPGASINDSFVEPDRRNGSMIIPPCCITGAEIHHWSELLSVYSQHWGWVSAYRGEGGGLQITVGCQQHDTFAAMRSAAHEYNVSEFEIELLNRFEAMVEVTRRQWTPGPTKSEPVGFGDLAERAREAAQDLTTPLRSSAPGL